MKPAGELGGFSNCSYFGIHKVGSLEGQMLPEQVSNFILFIASVFLHRPLFYEGYRLMVQFGIQLKGRLLTDLELCFLMIVSAGMTFVLIVGFVEQLDKLRK